MWWWANICARTTTSLKASSISCSAICGSVRSSCRSLSWAEVGHTSRSRRDSASIPAAARLKRSYSCSRRTSSARGSSSACASSLGRGSSLRDLSSASVAAITRYSPASSSCRSCMSSMYWMYWRVISASGISRIFRFCRRIRYSSRSSGPSKASRNTSRACGGMYRSRGSCEIGSPFTTANGISTCCGGACGVAGCGGVLETTIFRSGLCFIGVPAPAPSVGAQMHGAAHFVERLARDLARLVGALGDDSAHQLRVVLELLGTPAHAADFLHDPVDHRLLAFQAADAGAAATLVHPPAGALVGIDLVQVPHRTLLRVARIGAPHARRIGLHGTQLLHDLLGLLAQPDGVAVGLRHLAPIEPRDLRRRGEQHLRLRQDRHPGAFEKPQQPLAIGHRDAVVAVHQRLGALQRFLFAGLLELAAQLPVGGGVASPETLHRALRLRLEVRLTPVEVVEAPRGFAGELHVRHLILAHRHVGGAVHQDIGALQLRGLVVAGRQHVPVGDEEEALVLVLKLHPVAQRAVIVAEMQPPGGPHAGQHAPRRRRRTHVRRRSGPAGADGCARPATIRLWLTSRIIAHAP